MPGPNNRPGTTITPAQQAQEWARLGMNTSGPNAGQTAAPAPSGLFGYPQANWDALAAKGVPTSQSPVSASYVNAFQSALGPVRQNINNQLATALADIGANERAANSQFAQLPGQINQAYGQSTGTVQNALAAMTKAQTKSGLTPLMDLSAYTAPEMAAVNQSRNYQLQDVPMMQQGAQMEFGRQRAGANMQAQSALADLAMKDAEMRQQAMLAQSGQNHDIELERMREAAAAASDQRSALINAGAAGTARKQTIEDRNFAARQNLEAAHQAFADSHNFDSYADYAAAKSTPDYQYATAALQNLVKGNTDRGKILKGLKKAAGGFDSLKALLASGLIDQNELSTALKA